MQGRRIYPDAAGHFNLEVGDYAYWPQGGAWFGKCPAGMICNLGNHKVEEHEDGTITVSPSILINAGREPSWHGFLERGVWREC